MVNYQLWSPTSISIRNSADAATPFLFNPQFFNVFFCEFVFATEVVPPLLGGLKGFLLWGEASVRRPAVGPRFLAVGFVPGPPIGFLVELRQE
jgi:hypothetical protein